MKSQIIAQLGQTEVLLPALIAEGLMANDRVKTRLSLLQAAERHARSPQTARFDFDVECRAAGLDGDAMETLVNGASFAGERLSAPGLDALVAGIWDDVAAMAQAVKAGETAAGDAALARLTALKAEIAPGIPDTMALTQIAKLTAIASGPGDSLHRQVMDLHKQLNKLSADHAEEVVAGAHAYGLLPEDRPAVEAFMCGVESTRKLKFDHPGLATMATHAGGRLTIQNDIGETDAHVVVIAVEADVVTVTYTDVHRARAKFFTGLFRKFAVEWSGLDRNTARGLSNDGVFYLVTGRCPARDVEARDAFLEALGAALVFLIDWNKARKVLRNWVPKADAIAILDWAARNRYGHRAFLELGGAELVASAIRHGSPARIGFGDRLDSVLGHNAAVDFVKAVLRIAAEALLQGNSIRLVRDLIEADLVQRLERLDGLLLAIVARQCGLARDIASDIAQFIEAQQNRRPFDRRALAERAGRIEAKADKIAIDARGEVARCGGDPTIERLVDLAEQAIDELEQAAFLASLMPDEVAAELLAPLADLCTAAVNGAEAATAGVATATDVPDGYRADADDALAFVGRLIDAEHAADAAERAITAAILRGDFDLKIVLPTLEIARAIERATDRFAGFGHMLHQHVLTDLSS